jgi:hypothetical protein
MRNAKRVPAFVLGLFLFVLSPALAEDAQDSSAIVTELSFSGGTLWVEKQGGSGYWHSGMYIGKPQKWYVDIDITQVKSSLPWAETGGLPQGYTGKFGFDTPIMGLNLGLGFFTHDRINIEAGKTSLFNNGGKGYFAGFEAPFHLGGIDITPLFYRGCGEWESGSLYWFFGKPDLPSLLVYGLSLADARHTLSFRYVSADINIKSNDNDSLFGSHINAYSLYYTISLEKKPVRFEGTLGWFYAKAAVDGALTASNQHYFAFPFSFYNISGSLESHAGFANLDLQYSRSIFRCAAGIGLVHIFHNEGTAHTRYKWKKLFGGEESADELPLDIGGLGLAYMRLDAGISNVRIGREKNRRLSLGLQKIFLVPWGYERFFQESAASTGAAVSEEDSAKWALSVIFSGLSLYCSFTF